MHRFIVLLFGGFLWTILHRKPCVLTTCWIHSNSSGGHLGGHFNWQWSILGSRDYEKESWNTEMFVDSQCDKFRSKKYLGSGIWCESPQKQHLNAELSLITLPSMTIMRRFRRDWTGGGRGTNAESSPSYYIAFMSNFTNTVMRHSGIINGIWKMPGF